MLWGWGLAPGCLTLGLSGGAIVSLGLWAKRGWVLRSLSGCMENCVDHRGASTERWCSHQQKKICLAHSAKCCLVSKRLLRKKPLRKEDRSWGVDCTKQELNHPSLSKKTLEEKAPMLPIPTQWLRPPKQGLLQGPEDTETHSYKEETGGPRDGGAGAIPWPG